MARVRVGIVNDMSDDPAERLAICDWIEDAVAAVQATGRLAADVEYVHACGLGLPAGSADAVERAVMALVRQDVVLIVGPAIGDNALAATPWVEREQVPTINWAGAERARGEWMFHLQVGSHEDESLVIARHLNELGVRRAGVIYDRSPIGTKHLEYLISEAAILGLELGAPQAVAPLCDDARAAVDAALADAPDGFVYLGLGLSAPAVAGALAARGFSGPRIMNTAGIRGHDPAFARTIDGWRYVDMFSDGNRVLRQLREERGLSPAQLFRGVTGHDMGRLVAEGLARAPELSRDGVRRGLEQVKWLPAAEGADGTLLGFGIRDRGALHGRYLIVRQWRDGQSVEM
jgi:branched-chain amino acid transport system substrate-binding protein